MDSLQALVHECGHGRREYYDDGSGRLGLLGRLGAIIWYEWGNARGQYRQCGVTNSPGKADKRVLA